MSGEAVALQLALVRRNPWMLALGASPLVAAIACAIGAVVTKNATPIVFIPHLLMLSVALSTFVWIRNPRVREMEDAVVVKDDGVDVHGERVLERDDIKAGFVVPRPDKRPIVRLERKGLLPAFEIRVENEDEGRAVLRELGLDATQTIASFVLPPRLFAIELQRKQYGFLLGVLFAVMAILARLAHAHLLAFPILILSMAIGFAFAGLLTRTHVRIGADGLVLKWFRTQRFIPYDELRAIESYQERGIRRNRWAGVKLRLKSGEIITLPIAAASEVGGPRVRLVTNRLQEAFADHKQGKTTSPEARLLRGDKPIAAWVRDLRRAGAGAAANHRIAPIPTEKLLEVAEDPQADPIMRANAAIALGANAEDGEFRKRLRVAAQATAAPRLRVALEQAANVDDEAALAEALAEVEAEAQKTRAEQ